MNIGLIFPGQGSQYAGMGKNFINSPYNYFAKADQIFGSHFSTLCFDGPNDELSKTENTQPAILTHSMSYFAALKDLLKEHSIKVEVVLGHSVGEYAALTASGCLEFHDALNATKTRGLAMQSACPIGVGKMYAILRVPKELVEKACLSASNQAQQVVIANYNSASQFVISGHSDACDQAISYIEKNFDGKMRSVALNVSAPFHSPLMTAAEEKMKIFFTKIKLHPLNYPYIANIDAQLYGLETSSEQILNNLTQQIKASVLWEQSISKLNNIKLIEVGPGQVLKGLAKQISPNIPVHSMDQKLDLKTELEMVKDYLLN